MKTLIERALCLLPAVQDPLHRLSSTIHDDPELGFHEFHAAAAQQEILKKWGFSLTENIAGLPTAFRAEKIFGDGNGVSFGIFSEYDALVGLGHACGHNLICVSGLAAGYLAARMLAEENVSGRLSVFGSPGEEQLGGKVRMAASGAFRDLDCALISHPYDVTGTDDGAYSVRRFSVRFHGRASHAGMAPERGINALDALILFFNGIALWRQQLPEHVRVHGIIRKGGEAANIIPAETEAFFYLRAADPAITDGMEERFRAIVAGAALQTGCTCDCERVSAYAPSRVNLPLNAAYADCWDAMGGPVRRNRGDEGRGSTDFGDVSQLVPGANLHFGICAQPGTALHTEAFREAAATDFAFEQAMKCAAAMAAVCVRFFTDETFRRSVRDAFEGR